MNITVAGIHILVSIVGYMIAATIITRRNIIHDATSVPTTYVLRCSGCSLLFLVMATVVAVDDMIHPIAPAASIPPLEPIMRERMNPAYSTPAIITTKNQIPHGLKNRATRIG